MTSPLKVHNRFTPKNSCILLGMVYTKVVQRIVKFHVLIILAKFLPFSLIWDYIMIWERMFQTTVTSPLKVHMTFAPPKIMHVPREGLYQRIMKFEILSSLAICFFFFGHLTW